MATTVGQHSVAAFTSPVNGTTPIDANTVRGNDNTVRVAYVDHDADPGIHVQSSTLASRPVAGTAGRKWITEDSGLYTLWFDDGTNWHPVSSEAVALSVLATETLAKGDVVKVTGWNNGQDLPEVAKTTSASDTAFAVITAAVASGAMGYATNTGVLQDINTNAYNVGDILYANGSGGFTATKPTSGNYQPCAYVMRKNTNNGVIYVEFSTPRIVERSDNTASTIVLRDASGNFSAGTITATAVNTTTIDLTNLEVTNIKAKDGTASATIADSTGVMTIGSSVLTTTDINGGTIDGVTIGGASAGVGTFTTLNATTVNTTTLDLTNLEVTNIKAKDGTAAATIADSTGKITVSTELAVDNLNLSGNAITSTDTNGNIDLTPNGTGEVNITKVDIDSGAIDGTTIGGSSAAAGTFTTVAGTTGNITTVNATTVDTTNIEVTNVKAKDGTASIAIADSTGVATISAAPVLSALTASQAVFTDASKGLVSNAITGTGNVVMSASPTLSGTITAANVSMSGTLTLGSDVALSRGAADRLDLATGDSLNVVSGTYKIAGTDVLSSNTLGSGVTASSLTSVGTLTSLTVSGAITGATSTNTINGIVINSGAITGSKLTVSGVDDAINATYTANSTASLLNLRNATNGTAAVAGLFIGTDASSQTLGIRAYSSGYTTSSIAIADSVRLSVNRPGGLTIDANDSAGVIRFATGGISERMRLDASGNLGLGASTITAIGANVRTMQLDGTAGSGIRLYQNGSSNVYWYTSGSTATTFGTADARAIVFETNNTEKMRLDASGNLGLGVTPSAWSAGKAIEFGFAGTADWGGTQVNTYRTTNAYFNGSWKYGGTGAASLYAQESGVHSWHYAASGTAGNAITFTQAMTLDASGNLGVGVTPGVRLHVLRSGDGSTAGIAGGTYGIRFDNGGTFSSGMSTIHGVDSTLTTSYQPIMLNGSDVRFGTSATERARIDASGNLGLGTTSPAGAFEIVRNSSSGSGTAYPNIRLDNQNASGYTGLYFLNSGTSKAFFELKNDVGALTMGTGTTERARITSGGYFKASNDGTYLNSSGTFHEFRTTTNNNFALTVVSAANNGTQYVAQFRTSDDQNDATRAFLECVGGAAERATIRSNGGLANYSANNVNLASDKRLKKDIAPLTSTWDKLKAIEVVNFRYKDCNEGDPALYGVIAQQVQPIVPELVVVTREAVEAKDAVLDEDGNEVEPAVEAAPEYYGIREQPMYWLAIKALQEAQARIEALEARLEALEA